MRGIRRTILTFILFGFFNSSAQQVLQVAEKTFEKRIEVGKDDVLEVRSEKADVVIISGDINYISVKIVFTASHPDKAVATKELIYQKYAVGRYGKTIMVQTSYFLRDVKRVLSRMSAHIELTIPASMSVTAVGEYTDFTINDTQGSNNISMKFGKLTLKNISGSTTVNTTYGDIDGEKISGGLNIVGARSEIVLKVEDPSIEKEISIIEKQQVLNTPRIKIKNISGTIRFEKAEP